MGAAKRSVEKWPLMTLVLCQRQALVTGEVSFLGGIGISHVPLICQLSIWPLWNFNLCDLKEQRSKKNFQVNSVEVIILWECLSEIVFPDFSDLKILDLKLKWKDECSWVISNRIKYWNINCRAGLSLSTFACLRERDQSIKFFNQEMHSYFLVFARD